MPSEKQWFHKLICSIISSKNERVWKVKAGDDSEQGIPLQALSDKGTENDVCQDLWVCPIHLQQDAE